MKLLLLGFLLGMASSGHAIQVENASKKELPILLPDVEGWSGKRLADKNMHFVNFLTSEVPLFNVSIKYLPPARALSVFKSATTGCFLGGDPATLAFYVPHQLVFYKIFESRLFAYTLKAKPLQTMDAVTHIAVIRGFDIKKHLPTLKDKLTLEFNDLNQAFRMLERKRIQAFLYWESIPTELTTRLKKMNNQPLREDELGLNCIRDDSGIKLIDYIQANYKSKR